MSAPDRTNGHGSPYGGRPPFDGPIAPPQNLEAEQSVLGAVLLSDTALPGADHRRAPAARRTSTARATGASTRRCSTCTRSGEPVDALTLVEHLKQAGELEHVGGRAAIDLLAGSVPAVGNVRQYARIVRENAMLRRLLRAVVRDPGAASTATRRSRASSSTWPSARSSRSPTRTAARTSARSSDLLDAELDKLEQLSREGKAITGTAVRLRGPRHDHRRLPARQPDHPRRPPVDGQVGADGQLRRERGARVQQGRRAVLARDVRGRARAALHRLAGVDQGRRPAQGPGAAGRAGRRSCRRRTGSPSRRCTSTTRRTCRCSTCAPRPAGSRSRTPTGSA